MTGKPRASAPVRKTGNPIRDSALGLVAGTIEPYLALNRALWLDGPLSPAEVELVRLRNARTVNCVFCRSVRYDVARAAGLTEDKVAQIDDDYATSGLSPREKLLLAFYDNYWKNPALLAPELQQQLEAEFSAAELVHLSLVAAVFSAFSRCAVALGGMPESLPAMEVSVPGLD